MKGQIWDFGGGVLTMDDYKQKPLELIKGRHKGSGSQPAGPPSMASGTVGATQGIMRDFLRGHQKHHCSD